MGKVELRAFLSQASSERLFFIMRLLELILEIPDAHLCVHKLHVLAFDRFFRVLQLL